MSHGSMVHFLLFQLHNEEIAGMQTIYIQYKRSIVCIIGIFTTAASLSSRFIARAKLVSKLLCPRDFSVCQWPNHNALINTKQKLLQTVVLYIT